MGQDYTKIERPYGPDGRRDTSLLPEGLPSGIGESMGGPLPESTVEAFTTASPYGDKAAVNEEQWISGWIKSVNYRPKRIGFFLDARTGNVEFNNIVLTGGSLSYGKESFTDNAHAGYILSSEGVYFGSVGDTTYLKYDIATEELTMVGTIQTQIGTGKRIEISSADNDIRVYDGVQLTEAILIGSSVSSEGEGITMKTVASARPSLYIEKDGSNAAVDVRVLGGTASGLFVDVSAAGLGEGVTVQQHSQAPGIFATSDTLLALSGRGVTETSVDVGVGVAGAPAMLARVISGDCTAVYAVAEPTVGFSIPLVVAQNSPVSTDFYRYQALIAPGLQIDNFIGTSDPNGVLTGTPGSLCQVNAAGTGQVYKCTSGTTWVAV